MDCVTKRKSRSCPRLAISIEELRDHFASIVTLQSSDHSLKSSSGAEACLQSTSVSHEFIVQPLVRFANCLEGNCSDWTATKLVVLI